MNMSYWLGNGDGGEKSSDRNMAGVVMTVENVLPSKGMFLG